MRERKQLDNRHYTEYPPSRAPSFNNLLSPFDGIRLSFNDIFLSPLLPIQIRTIQTIRSTLPALLQIKKSSQVLRRTRPALKWRWPVLMLASIQALKSTRRALVRRPALRVRIPAKAWIRSTKNWTGWPISPPLSVSAYEIFENQLLVSQLRI